MKRYFGLLVKVIQAFEHYSLVRYGERSFVADNADLLEV